MKEIKTRNDFLIFEKEVQLCIESKNTSELLQLISETTLNGIPVLKYYNIIPKIIVGVFDIVQSILNYYCTLDKWELHLFENIDEEHLYFAVPNNVYKKILELPEFFKEFFAKYPIGLVKTNRYIHYAIEYHTHFTLELAKQHPNLFITFIYEFRNFPETFHYILNNFQDSEYRQQMYFWWMDDGDSIDLPLSGKSRVELGKNVYISEVGMTLYEISEKLKVRKRAYVKNPKRS
jgi:hypothetical protein